MEGPGRRLQYDPAERATILEFLTSAIAILEAETINLRQAPNNIE